jgi:soluble lytic murein transglycosylase-like protein
VSVLLFLLFAWHSDSLERQRAAIEKQWAAIELQKNSVRRQIQLAPAVPGSFFLISDPADRSPCQPLSVVRQQALVDSASRKAGVPADLLTAVIQEESGFRPCSVSEKGALGLGRTSSSNKTLNN